MKNMKKFCCLFAAATLALFSLTCYADTTQNEIDAMSSVKQQAEGQLASTEERIAALEAKKGESEAYLTELNQQLSELSENLSILQTQYEEKQSELAVLEGNLKAARQNAGEQYEDMKLRIQYMYENSTSTGVLEALFSAESFTEFLNRAETMNELTKYDREMLQQYQETVLSIENQEAQVRQEKEMIEILQADYQGQKEQIQDIYRLTFHDVLALSQNLENESEAQAALLAEIQQHQDQLDQLIARQMQEEIERQRAAEEARIQAEIAAAEQAERDAWSQVIDAYETVKEADPTDSFVDSTPDIDQGLDTPSVSDGSGVYLGNFKLTAYCPCAKCCGVWAANPGATASGVIATPGITVAMGGVPFGTQLLINGHVYTVQDRGTSYGHVDIYFASHSEALNFGLKYADVYQLN